MSFLEGFAGSLAGYFGDQAKQDAAAEREMMSYERKLAMAKKLEETTPVRQEVYKVGDQYMAVGVNSSGKQVGEERPATGFEVQAQEKIAKAEKVAEEDRALNRQNVEGQIRDRNDSFNYRGTERKMAQESHDSSIASNVAQRNYTNKAAATLGQGSGRGASGSGESGYDRASDVEKLLANEDFVELQDTDPAAAQVVLNSVTNKQMGVSEALLRLKSLGLTKAKEGVSSQLPAQDTSGGISTYLNRYNPQ